MKQKKLHLPASAAAQTPVSQPLGPATISGTTITVDQMAANPTIIPGIIRNLVAANRGYFADKIFNTPGFPVTGGVVLATPTKPSDGELFLPSGESIAPRAPGAEAPTIGSERPELVAYYPENWAGTIEITDEAKRRNDQSSIARQLSQAANTFINTIQKRAVEVLAAFAASQGREKAAKAEWDEAYEKGTAEVPGAKLPGADFAYVEQLFLEDEAGETASVLLLNPADAFNLKVTYGDKLTALLDLYNITLVVSPRVEAGTSYWVADGGVGDILYEHGLEQESERFPRRKTTEVTMETAPVFVPLDGYKVWKLKEMNS